MNGVCLTFIDGQLSEALPQKKTLLDIATLSDSDVFTLHFAKNIRSTTPIYLKFLNSGKLFSKKIMIVAEENSEIVLIEEHARSHPENAVAFSEGQVEIEFRLMAGAHIDYYRLHSEGLNKARILAEQNKKSTFNLFFAECGGQSAHITTHIRLQETDAACHLKGLYFLNQDHQQLVQHIEVEHAAAKGTSSMLFKGVLDRKSRAIFHGKVHIHSHALHSKTEQANHNLLLSADAQVKSEPHLEIYADEVKCRHGSTVGQLDPESLFYLRSRGLSKAEAIKLLMQAFVAEIIEPIKESYVRRLVEERVTVYAEL